MLQTLSSAFDKQTWQKLTKEWLQRCAPFLQECKKKYRASYHALRKAINEEKNFLADTSLITLRKPTISTHAILWSTALFFVIALAWANFAVLDEVTVGEGKIIPSSKTQVIQSLEAGFVAAILVKEGDNVKKGQVLMHIDDTRYASSYQESALKALALKAKIARLDAQAKNAAFAVPNDPAFKTHPEFISSEHALYDSQSQEQQSKIQTLTSQIKQQHEELAASEAKLAQLTRSHELANKELMMTKPLLKRGAVSEVEVLRLERQVNDLAGELATTKLSIPRAKAAIDESQSKINELTSAFRSNAQKDLSAASSELASLTASNIGLADRVKHTAIRSLVNGTVKTLKIVTIGGVVQPGMDLIEIVPTDDSLLIKARIRPSDIGFLHRGQEATVKISAYDFAIYGGLAAIVEDISADTMSDEKGNSYYQIYVRTTKNHLGNNHKPLHIKPGMMVSIDILTGKKTVMDYLLKPILKAKNNALRER